MAKRVLKFRPSLVLGTDICLCTRLLDYRAPKWPRIEKLLNKFLTDGERKEVLSKFGWLNEANLSKKVVSFHMQRFSLHIAGRWAAKEAAKKAWGADIINWKDLYIGMEGEDRNRSYIAVSPSGIDREQQGRLTISHDGDYATATVLAECLVSDIKKHLEKSMSEVQAKYEPKTTLKSEKTETKRIDKPFDATGFDFDNFLDFTEEDNSSSTNENNNNGSPEPNITDPDTENDEEIPRV